VLAALGASPARSSRDLSAALWVTGGCCVVAGLAAAAALLWGGYSTPGDELSAALVLTLGVGWSFSGLGLVAWVRWPGSLTGPLMVAVGLAWFARAFGALDAIWAFEVGILVGAVYLAVLGHLMVTYPSGRLVRRRQKVVVAAVYLCTVPTAFVARWVLPGGRDCVDCPYNQLTDEGSGGAADRGDQILLAMVIGMVLAALVLMLHQWRTATSASRRSLSPALWGASAILAVLVVQRVGVILDVSEPLATFLSWSVTAVLVLWPLGLIAGLARARLDRSAVADLVVELGGTLPLGGMRSALARALHDPTLELAFWLPDRQTFVDEDGAPVATPIEDARHAVSMLTRHGDPVAALVHDPALDDQPELVTAVAAAAGLALENERLHAEARAHLAETRASRTRIVDAADAERRRVERNLHDGAQQRMLNLMLALSRAKGRMSTGALGPAREALDQATRELALAMEELRDLARGIHPAVLSDSGLGPAVRALAQRSSVPVRVSDALHEQRFDTAVEETAYFIVSEALANVAKHAAASEAVVSIGKLNGDVVVDVTDDGVGGASPNSGTGLRGLQDRVDAYSGTLRIDSLPGQGTHIRAALPCG
jgi:signal transduction histidine kinase